jgi:carboxyl-terminal processing protease
MHCSRPCKYMMREILVYNKTIWESMRWAVSGIVLGIGIAMAIGAVSPDIRMPYENSVVEANYGEQFQTIIEGLQDNNVNQENMLSEDEMFKIAIGAILETLGDQHGAYFNPDDFAEFKEDLSPSNYTGVGMIVGIGSQGILVMQIFDDSLLRFAGVTEGDFIYAVGNPGEDYIVFAQTPEGGNFREVVAAITGPAGTDVNLKIKRNSTDLGIITVQRIETRAQHVFMKLTDTGILDIRITKYSGTITDDILFWLNEKDLISDDGVLSDDVKAVVTDLRFNPGGYLSSGVKLSDMFVEKGLPIVTVVANDGDAPFAAESVPLFPSDMPKVFLINGSSASSSEITAGVVQHHKVAFIFGNKSFGKGSVQTTFDLPGGGAYKTTTAKYLVAGTVAIDGIGVTPDVVVTQPPSPGLNANWQQLNLHLIRISMDPEIDHQLHAAHEFLMRFVDGRFSLDSEPSVKASRELVQETQTLITKDLCEEKGLKGCPEPAMYGNPSRGRYGWRP